MCGRARCSLAPDELATATSVPREQWRDMDRYKPSYNASPGAYMPILAPAAAGGGQLELRAMRWGLVPSYTRPGEKRDFYRMFNARSETVAVKSVFKRLLASHRCCVPLNGFYEWHAQGGRSKQPYYVYLDKQPFMTMAGLYDVWRDSSSGEELATFTILTTDSCKPLEWLHDRMPVILPDQASMRAWLAGEPLPNAAAAAPPAVAGATAPEAPAAASGDGACSSEGGGGVSPPPSLPAAIRAAGEVKPEGKGRREAGEKGHGQKAAGSTSSGGEGHEEEEEEEGEEEQEGPTQHGASPSGRARPAEPDASGRRRRRSKGGGGKGGGGGGPSEKILQLVSQVCHPYGGELLRWHPVTPDMGKPAFDGPQCSADVRAKKGAITSFFKPKPKPEPQPQALPASAGKGGCGSASGDGGARVGALEGGGAAAPVRNTDECAGAGGDVAAGKRGAAAGGGKGAGTEQHGPRRQR